MLDSAALGDLIAELVGDHVERAIAPLVQEIGELKQALQQAGEQLPAQVDAQISERVAAAVAQIPVPQDGKSITVEDIEPIFVSMVERAVAEIPVPKNGTSVTLEDVQPMVRQAIADAIAEIPPPKDGESVTMDQVSPVLAEMVAAAVAKIPAPKDGTSVTVEDLRPVVRQAVDDAVAQIPAPRDGVGAAKAIIDRSGNLALTLTNGDIVELGPVVGRDGLPGMGLDDLTVSLMDDGRTVRFAFVQGQREQAFDLTIPSIIDRGTFREGQTYDQGDAVTWGGSLWIAQRKTSAKPDTEDSGWRVGARKGRDGKSASS